MILMYHKVDAVTPTPQWVSIDAFYGHMNDLQAYDVVPLDDYDPANPRQAVITFDDVYDGVVKFAAPVMRDLGYPFEMFVNSDWIGRENSFDRLKEPRACFASLEQIDRAAAMGGRVQWHTRSHARLRGVTGERLARELAAPADLQERYGARSLRWFAYPYGDFDEAALEAARARFAGAVATAAGDDSDRFQLTRVMILEDTVLSRSTVSVVIVNCENGCLLAEAIESVLRQKRRPDDIVVVDDASHDNTRDVLACFANDVRVEYHPVRRGMAACRRQGVELARGDYVTVMSAEHRLRSDFIECGKGVLDRRPEIDAVYGDAAVFGAAAALPTRFGGRPIAVSRRDGPIVQLDISTADAFRELAHCTGVMYRRRSWKQEGGFSAPRRAGREEGVPGNFAPIAAPLTEWRCGGGAAAGLEIENWRLRKMLAERDARLVETTGRLAPRVQVQRFLEWLAAPMASSWRWGGGLGRRWVGQGLRRIGIDPGVLRNRLFGSSS